jgi:hypothetical protein
MFRKVSVDEVLSSVWSKGASPNGDNVQCVLFGQLGYNDNTMAPAPVTSSGKKFISHGETFNEWCKAPFGTVVANWGKDDQSLHRVTGARSNIANILDASVGALDLFDTGTGEKLLNLLTPNEWSVIIQPLFVFNPTIGNNRTGKILRGTHYDIAIRANDQDYGDMDGGDPHIFLAQAYRGFYVNTSEHAGAIHATYLTSGPTVADTFASVRTKVMNQDYPVAAGIHIVIGLDLPESVQNPISLTAFTEDSGGSPRSNSIAQELSPFVPAVLRENVSNPDYLKTAEADLPALKNSLTDKSTIHSLFSAGGAGTEITDSTGIKYEPVMVVMAAIDTPPGTLGSWEPTVKYVDKFTKSPAYAREFENFVIELEKQGYIESEIKRVKGDKKYVMISVQYRPKTPDKTYLTQYFTKPTEDPDKPYIGVNNTDYINNSISYVDNSEVYKLLDPPREAIYDGATYKLVEYAVNETAQLRRATKSTALYSTGVAGEGGTPKSTLDNARTDFEKALKNPKPNMKIHVLLRYEKLPEPPVPPQGRFGITVQLPNPNPKSIPTGTTSEPAQFKIEMDQTKQSDKASDIEEWQTWVAEVKNHAKALSKTAAFKIKIDITETATNLTPNTSAPTSSAPYSVTDSLERGISSTELLDLLKDSNGTLFNYTTTFDTSKYSYSLKAAATVSILAYYDGTLMSQVDLTPDPGEATARWTTPDPNDKYSFTSIPHGNAFSEIKQGNIGNETFEAMAGTPTTQNLYFASGGDQFVVQVKMRPMRA